MTTIAYRAGVLATDSLSVIDGKGRLPGRSLKIWRLKDGTLAAGAGDAFAIANALRAKDNWQNIRVDGYGSQVLSVHGKIVRIHQQGSVIEMAGAKFTAIGSGAVAALGALHAGASAVEAVRAAIKVDIFSGGPVQSQTVFERK